MCRQGKCTCDFECEPSDPVCGEDGISYPNACLMRRSTCKRAVEVKVSHPGRCQTEVDKTEESSGSGGKSDDHDAAAAANDADDDGGDDESRDNRESTLQSNAMLVAICS